jgi:formylglycine-generating enzyme required for sulfatase activity
MRLNSLPSGRRIAVLLTLSAVAWFGSCQKVNVPVAAAQPDLSAPGMEAYVETIGGTGVSFAMVPVPAGTFLMGSPEGETKREADEGPQVKAQLDAFWMMDAEVTWDLFELFIDKEKSAALLYASDDIRASADAVTRPSTPYLDPSFGMGRYGYPAVSMTQYAALSFCKWLSEFTGKLYRLPTEAEWEYACRAGSSTAYCFGDDVAQLGDYAWYWDNSGDKYHQIKQKKPNAWGLYDMHGNVAEWTLDQYEAEFYASLGDNALNPWRTYTSLHPRTVRGGSWYHDAEELRSAARMPSSRDWQKRDPQIPKSFWWNTDAPFLGFRLVRPAGEKSPSDIRDFFAKVLDE